VVGIACLRVAECVPRNGSLDGRHGAVETVEVREEHRNVRRIGGSRPAP
jgi:hypothetical protein